MSSFQNREDFSHGPLSSILPIPAFIKEEAAIGLGLDRIDRLGPLEFVNLITYMASNNFPGETNIEEVYHWLKTRQTVAVLGSLASIDSITTKAFLEGIFRLAVEAGDTPTVIELMRLNVNPNGHQIRLERILGTLNPLQYACITGNTELAQALIEAGAAVKDTKRGWKRSILVLAIIGEYKALSGFYDKVEHQVPSPLKAKQWMVADCVNIEAENGSEFEDNGCCVYHTIRPNAIRFIQLVESLIRAGANVAVQDSVNRPEILQEACEETESDGYDDNDEGPDAFLGCDSPLAAAAKYKHPYLVDRFLELGADANFLSEMSTSPLQECLFSTEEATIVEKHGLDGWEISKLKDWMLARSRSTTYGCQNIVTIARSLLYAHANPNQVLRFCDQQCTPLDIAILGDLEDLVGDLLIMGANPTQSSLEYAIQGGNIATIERLLDGDAPLTQAAMTAAAKTLPGDLLKTLLTERNDPRFEALVAIEALRSGLAEDLLDLKFLDFTVQQVHIPLLRQAVNDCCFTGRIGLLCKLLKSQHALRSILLPMIPSALNSLIQAYVSRPEVCETLIAIIENNVTLIASCSEVLLSAIQRNNQLVAIRLIKAGVPLNSKTLGCTDPDHHGDLLVMAVYHSNPAIVRELLKAGADINALGRFQNTGVCSCTTPLAATLAAISCHHGTIDWVQFLLEQGADPIDELAFETAISSPNIAQTLLASALDKVTRIPPVASGIWHAVFKFAILQRNPDLAFTILDRRLLDPNLMWGNLTPLCTALRLDYGPEYKFMGMLLKNGVDLNIPIRLVACEYTRRDTPQSSLMVAITSRDQHKICFLLRHGTLVNTPYDVGYEVSVLQHAIKDGADVAIVTLLLNWKADPNSCTQYEQRTPLQLAIKRNNLDMIQVLLKHGADPNLVRSRTCLQMAVDNGDLMLVKLLLDHRAEPDLVSREDEHTPLQTAARDGNKEIAELLLAHGANVNAPPFSNSGATALQFAAIGGYLGIAFLLLGYQVDVNAAGAPINGRTALEGAAEHGRIDMIKMLLNAGADVHGEGQIQYQRALEFASNNGHHAARQMLEEHHG